VKRLFYFAAQRTEVGVMPSFYDEVDECFARDAIAAGGIDVSDDPHADAAFAAQHRNDSERDL